MADEIQIEVTSEPIPLIEVHVDFNAAQTALDALAAMQQLIDDFNLSPLSQDNMNVFKYISTTPDNNTLTDVVAQINALPSFSVTDKQTLWIECIVSFLAPGLDVLQTRTERYATDNIGKGTYGAGGIQITESNIKLIYSQAISSEDVELNPDNQVIIIETLGEVTISEYVNAKTPPYEIQSDNVRMFKVTDGESYIFTADGGDYGDGELQTIDDDFTLIPNSFSGIDDVLAQGNFTTRNLIFSPDGINGNIGISPIDGGVSIADFANFASSFHAALESYWTRSGETIYVRYDSIVKVLTGGFATILKFVDPTDYNEIFFPNESGIVATREFLSSLSVISNANMTASTSLVETDTDLTADRTITLSATSPIKEITIRDSHQTVYKNGFKLIITVEAGKTLNGVEDGIVWLGKQGSEIRFNRDDNGNFTYAVPEKKCVFTFDAYTDTGVTNLKTIQNTTTTDLSIDESMAASSGGAEILINGFDIAKHRLEYTVNGVSIAWIQYTPGAASGGNFSILDANGYAVYLLSYGGSLTIHEK